MVRAIFFIGLVLDGVAKIRPWMQNAIYLNVNDLLKSLTKP